MDSAEIRQRFLNFFKERDHKVLPSSSLIPFNDPSVLLTTAGMLQFKPYFLGQAKPPYPRVATCQKVFRTSDIELVGRDGHHLTFFEMLGNFSFGDYFKEKAIPYAFELLTRDLGLDPKRLWAGIHNDDDESFEIWLDTGIPAERIRRFGDEYNFWAAGPTGPCGPDSEIHYDWGHEYSCGRPDCGPNCEYCDRFLEIWNLVFMQWDRDESGRLTPLTKKGIDTGMGLNRITQVVSHKRSVFETDMFVPIIKHFEGASTRRYGEDGETDISLRVLADHSRGAAMLVADGVVPSNEGRGYVLRRLIRRAMVHARRLGVPGVSSAVPVVDELLGDVYPELRQRRGQVEETLRSEEERFAIALRTGMERLQGLLDRGALTPEEVFYLHDTLGFPIELTKELAEERGVQVDQVAVAELMQGQRQKSRGSAASFTAPMAKSQTRFVGYDELEADTTVLEIFPVSGEAEMADVFLAETPFYAERGGQAADTGWLSWSGGRAEVIDVQPQGESIRHRVRVGPSQLSTGLKVRAQVDRARRADLARHHSATHLLHRALREVLGEQATQAGSALLPAYATFDFRFPRALTQEELLKVESLLNEKIRANLERSVKMMPLKDAVASGAVALFDEKYGDTVRVVSFGKWASELCGGTHVERSGEIGMALITPDRSIGAGTRRIELRAGKAAEEQVRLYEQTIARLADLLKGAPADLPAKVEGLQVELKQLQKEMSQLRRRLATGDSHEVELAHVNGISIALQRVSDEKDLLDYADLALNRPNGPGIAVIVGGRRVAVKVAPALVERLEAGGLVRAFTAVAGGKGGGRGPVGEGGGIDPDRVPEAFRALQAWIGERLKDSR
jgi:alanyl-tRNA synthetase